jgi:hypothetical protein
MSTPYASIMTEPSGGRKRVAVPDTPSFGSKAFPIPRGGPLSVPDTPWRAGASCVCGCGDGRDGLVDRARGRVCEAPDSGDRERDHGRGATDCWKAAYPQALADSAGREPRAARGIGNGCRFRRPRPNPGEWERRSGGSGTQAPGVSGTRRRGIGNADSGQHVDRAADFEGLTV